jgi:hypothetical protein
MIARVTITKPARWLRREQREPLNDTRNAPCGSAFLLCGLPPKAGGALLFKVDGGAFSATAPFFATDGSADGAHTVWVEQQDDVATSPAHPVA